MSDSGMAAVLVVLGGHVQDAAFTRTDDSAHYVPEEDPVESDEPLWLLSSTGEKLHNPDSIGGKLYARCDPELEVYSVGPDVDARAQLLYKRCKRCEAVG